MEELPLLGLDASASPGPPMPAWDTDRLVTYSRSFTVDLTYRCLARCGYCEYRSDEGGLISAVEVERLLDLGEASRCREVLVMSGEKPWELPDIATELVARYPDRASQEIRKIRKTAQREPQAPAAPPDPVAGAAAEDAFVDLAVEVCRAAMGRGLLPHANLGVLSRRSLERLKPWNVSMGLMLENLREDLKAHSGAYHKIPAERIRHIADAGELRIPFTTGILVGIGESGGDRRTALEAIAGLHRRYGQIEEVIVQDFQPKPGTPMADQPPPDAATMAEAVRDARRILPAEVKVQVPPNLLAGAATGTADWADLLDEGARDLGGISINGDSVSPHRAWPAVEAIESGVRSRNYRPSLWVANRAGGCTRGTAGDVFEPRPVLRRVGSDA